MADRRTITGKRARGKGLPCPRVLRTLAIAFLSLLLLASLFCLLRINETYVSIPCYVVPFGDVARKMPPFSCTYICDVCAEIGNAKRQPSIMCARPRVRIIEMALMFPTLDLPFAAVVDTPGIFCATAPYGYDVRIDMKIVVNTQKNRVVGEKLFPYLILVYYM